jgi:hypothetical protein
MTVTGRLIVLGAVIGAGLIAGRAIARVRRSSCFSEIGEHVAIFDAAGSFIRCEDSAGRQVGPEHCTGAAPCREPGAGADDADPDR